MSENSSDIASSRNSRETRFRILLVDDDHDIVFTLKVVLEENGFIVNSFSDATRAISEYTSGHYDLVILDVKMPKISGFDFYRQVRNKNPDAIVCFLTAGETYYQEFRKQFPELNENHYLMKPVENNELVKRAITLIDEAREK